MFSKSIVDSDAFLDMPLSTQALYFHFGMRADDDGFVNSPRKIQKMISASEDDIKVLIAKGFIIPFDSGVVVIKHWKMHNTLKSDRYKPTAYQEEKALLFEKPNKSYTLDPAEAKQKLTSGTEPEPLWNQPGTELEPQLSVDKRSINKRSGSVSAPNRKRFAPPTLDEVREYMTAYATEHNMQIDADLQAEKFIAYHESRGWVIGKNNQQMKRWKGAAGTWMCNIREQAQRYPKNIQHPTQHMRLHDRIASSFDDLYA